MPGVLTLHLELAGDVQLNRTLLRITDRARDLRPIFTALSEDFYLIEARQFDTEGAAGGSPWPPLAPSTLARKMAKGQDTRILRATGALERSLTHPHGKGSRRLITRTTLRVGTSVTSAKGFPYAMAHQNPQGGHLPRRRVLQLSAADRMLWPRALQRFLFTGDVGVR